MEERQWAFLVINHNFLPEYMYMQMYSIGNAPQKCVLQLDAFVSKLAKIPAAFQAIYIVTL